MDNEERQLYCDEVLDVVTTEKIIENEKRQVGKANARFKSQLCFRELRNGSQGCIREITQSCVIRPRQPFPFIKEMQKREEVNKSVRDCLFYDMNMVVNRRELDFEQLFNETQSIIEKEESDSLFWDCGEYF